MRLGQVVQDAGPLALFDFYVKKLVILLQFLAKQKDFLGKKVSPKTGMWKQ